MKNKALATFTRVKRAGKIMATFQNSRDAIIYADEFSAGTGFTVELWEAIHYGTDTGGIEIEETLMMVSKPIK